MSLWSVATDAVCMDPSDELRLILSEHCHPLPQKDRALHLLDTLLQQEERRRAAAGDITGGMASQGFAVRPNGEITGPGHTSAFGDEGLGANGVMWGGSGLVPAWGKGVGVGDIQLGGGMGPWGADGLGAGSTGWGFPGGSRVASGSNGGLAIDDEAAGLLSGLALDAPGGPWIPTPVPSFELDSTPAQDSRLGAFFISSPVPAAPLVSSNPGQPHAPSLVPSQVPPPQLPQVQVQAPQPQQPLPPQPKPGDVSTQGSTAVKFSSVVGGAASGRPQVSSAVTAAVVEEKPKGASLHRVQARPETRPPPPKVEPKRSDPKRIDVANTVVSTKGGTTSKVKLRGLPYGATTMDVVNFFRGFGVVESAVQFGVNSDGRPSGEAWISFARLEDARRAVREKDRHHMGDRYVELFLLNEVGGVASRGFK